MASVKPSNEKPGPRLVPRPTTASAARAARNAHRMPAATPRQSPIRPAAVTPVAVVEVKKEVVVNDTEKHHDQEAAELQQPQRLNIDGDLQNVYCTKQNEFHQLKKELDLKQQSVLQVFDTLRRLQERMQEDGIQVRESVSQELIIFNVGDWTTQEISQMCRDAEGSAGDRAQMFNKVNPIDDATIAALETEARKVPEYFAELCFKAFTVRQEVIDWMKDLAEKNEIPSDVVKERISQYNLEGLRLYEILEKTKTESKNTMDSFTSLTKQFCQDRSTLIRVEESLVRELARLKQAQEPTEVAHAIEEARQELEKERTAKSQLKEKLATTETQLRYARTRVTQMDKQLKEAEASIASLTATVKSLEDKSRQKEISLEARARKLKESLKTGEVTSSQLLQQKNGLQTELHELKENLKIKENQYKSRIEELNEKFEKAMASLEHEQELLQRERNVKDKLAAELNMSQNVIEELQNKICDLESKHNIDLPTEREMDLFSELSAVKETLRIAEDEILACKNEKIRFLERLTKETDSDDKIGAQQKLAAELMSKEEIISNMQIQIRELIKNVKLNEKKVAQYAQYVHELHSRAAVNSPESPDTNAYQDIQNEVMDLKMHLLEVSTRNEELLERLTEKDQLLQQQEKTARAQAKVIKVLKNKETEQSSKLVALQQDLERRMKIVDNVNKQIEAKANEIEELFSTLESKQQLINRLEKIVLELEGQQRRSQAQRTRHEEKIAVLEHELAEGARRERKFLFF
ncbi:COP1-interactive protein 1-like [Aricia agestis]|uniref:COP1-interactive protein 1-like n=1 Tax=Aricia agestis TaxID=91739 RepID=UPI001C20815B|nr:COP1-interactive protein 1-like [Aricia agestis]